MIDQVTVAVIGSAFRATVGEMGEALRRSSHSPIIREMFDYSCAIFTAEGDTVAQDDVIPALLNSMVMALPELLKENPLPTIKPGDIFIGNDPYRGCTHTPDIHLFAPVFADGKLVAWVGNLAHHADIGGTNPGTEGFANRSVFEEGLRFPYVKLFEEGKACEPLFRYIENNVRDPRSSLGDLRAQVAAAKLGVRRMDALIEKYGASVIGSAMTERIDQSERRVRAAIAACPDGKSNAVGYLDDDGCGGEPVRIEISVEIKGDEIVVDFTGTGPQMEGGMNASSTAAMAAVMFAVKAGFDADGEQTAGSLRPITMILPEGSAVNPRFPAAVSLRHLAAQRVCDTLIRALAEINPKLESAGAFVGFSSMAAECRHPRSNLPVVMSDDLGGGLGGHTGGDGLSAVDTYLGNVGILPMEICELQYPIRIGTTELAVDSAGVGEYRGGLGIRRVYEFLDTCDVVFYTEQTNPEFAPWGKAGGRPGRPAKLILERADGSTMDIHKNRVLVQAGDKLIAVTGGGGGYGDPKARDKAAIARDLREGKITAEAVKETYGIEPAELPQAG
ncbi:hydantoinase B/oxoprolinase family protein [Methyloligella sp. 2.7D]|uniref:hydantoinase B/oxoprolinase family protein n=1 Tax=unclassified Methyloligella TaxID=2625955 RepID=UPI00157E1C18|nr:hydantoinase B/oxoprolinase family protein [Methyloligella sp. GL2]QKP76000.1 hydantoinase B/oxoprolinase family protein [Methyloligella sp. GL2]